MKKPEAAAVEDAATGIGETSMDYRMDVDSGQAGGNGKSKTSHGRIPRRDPRKLRPSPENLRLYGPLDSKDSEIIALSGSVKRLGVLEPLVVTTDDYILSGHRRRLAAVLAGLKTVPTRVHPISRKANPDEFLVLLREHNRQRMKTRDQQLREEVVSADPEQAYQALLDHRQKQSEVWADTIEIRGEKHRAKISRAKIPMLNAVVDVLNEYKEFWPLSDRLVHYALLNDPPLRHKSKPNSRYRNDPKDYHDLTNLLTRARIAGVIPWNIIADATRPVVTWAVDSSLQGFIRKDLDSLFKNYFRNMLQSQPNHIEVVGERNTLESIIQPVVQNYGIPFTLGRGFCSSPPRHDMAQRYRKSGKEKLVILILSDFDPDGDEIAHSYARSMRDDFGVLDIEPVHVALSQAQVKDLELPAGGKAKKGSPNYKKFVKRYGSDNVYELEAVPPDKLQEILRASIDSVLDVPAFNHELDEEKKDAAFLQTIRKQAHERLKGLAFGENGKPEPKGEDT